MDTQKNPAQISLLDKFSNRFGVDSNKLFNTLKVTAFKQKDGSAPTNEQMLALLLVANQYDLNPFTREIYAFPDKTGGIVPVVGIDGWARIINNQPSLDGIEFSYSEKLVTPPGGKICPEWCEVSIYRKDRTHPTKVREYLDEVYRVQTKFPTPWQTHTKRMIRHKALIQTSRIAFGFVGIFDQDEAERIVEAQQVVPIQEAEIVIDEQKLIPRLQKIANRAIATNAWTAAFGYIAERYFGNELHFANEYLRAEQAKSIQNATATVDCEAGEIVAA